MTAADAIRVVVTRPRRQSAELTRLLTRAGFAPVALPLLDIAPLPVAEDAWEVFATADVVVVTSPTGAHRLAESLEETGHAVPGTARVAAVGRESRSVLEASGITVHVTPARATGAALADALTRSGIDGARVVLARAREGRAELADGLRAAGAEVIEFPLYAAIAAVVDSAMAGEVRDAEAWTVTSPRIVDAAVSAVGRETLRGATVVSIGPTTTAHARSLGIDVAAEAEEQSAAGLVAALIGVRPAR